LVLHLFLALSTKKKCGDHVIPARKGGGPLDFDFVQQIEDFIDSDLPERDIMIRVLFIGYLFNLKRIREKTIINRKKNKDHDERIQRITSYIDKNPSKKMTLDFFSEEYYINKYYLCHLFKKETGFTIIEYINNKRIILAKKLMLENKSIIDSCYAAGFTDYPNFYKIFKRTTGVSPREYIRSNKN
jgi:AraC-like DNA-binding protein